jgi:hypothetical protein
MRTLSTFRAILLTTGLGTGLAARAQTAPAPVAPPAPVAAPVEVAAMLPTTVLKLGTVLTNRSLLGFGSFVPLPLQAGVERRLNPHWALTGDFTVLSVAGNRAGLTQEGFGLRVLRLGAEAGVRRYYRAAAHPTTGAYGGNYVALNTRIEALPYGALLLAGKVGLSAQWGMQRRVGGHGLADGFVGLGAETSAAGLGSSQPVRRFVSPTAELGLRLSLVR